MRLLFFQRDPADVELLVAELRDFGFDLEHARVDSASALRDALADRKWSAVVSELDLDAVRIIRSVDRELPVLVVSNDGEERATEAIRAGANDFLLKTSLHRLGTALERELRDVQLRHERRSLFDALRRAEDRYRRVFERLPVGVGISTPDGRLIAVNERLASIHGFTTSNIVGRNVLELGWDSRRMETWSERPYVRADGTVVWTRVTAAPVLNDDGAIEQRAWLVEDITAQKRHEGELRAHKEQLDDAQQMARLGSFVHVLETGERVWSDEMYRIWGMKPGEPLQEPAISQRIHRDDRDRVASMQRAILELRKPYAGDYRIVLPSGEIRTVNERGRVLFDDHGRATRVVGVVHDVTEARAQQEELQRRAVQQALVANLGQAALSGEGIEVLFTHAAEHIATLLGVDHCAIWQTRGERFLLRSSFGWEGADDLEIDRASETQAAHTARTGAPVIVDRMDAETRFEPSPFLTNSGIVSGVTVPISAGTVTVWGVLGAHAATPRTFSTSDVDFLRSVATVLGQAVERDRVDQQLVLHAAQQSAIAELSRIALTSAEDAIPRACNIVRNALDVDLSLFLELDEARAVLRSTAGSPNVPALTIPVAGSQSGLSLEQNRAVVIEDFNLQPLGPWRGLGLTSGITVPIISIAHRFGVLTAHSRRKRIFDDAHVALMQSLGNILADALEREHARRALAASEARYRAVVEGASEIIFTSTAEGIFTALNAAFENITGWRVRDFIGKPIEQLIAPQDKARAATLLRQVVERQESVAIEVTIDAPNGSLLLDVTCFPRIERGRTIAVYGFARDVTAPRRIELERQQLTRNLQLLLESTVEGILTIDCDGRCMLSNAAATRILGRKPDEFVGCDIRALLPRAHVEAILDVARTGEVHSNTDTFVRGDGTPVPVEYSAAPVIDAGVRVGVVISFSDISERQRLEARLEQADRLSSLGRLAATVAHEFNNVLMGISPFVEVMRRGRNVEASLEHIARAVKRGKRITEDILRFTQPAEPVRAAIDTVSWLDQVVHEARTLLPKHYQLECAVEPRDLLIYGDANQLHQIFSNLILNARDAMPKGGTLSIRARREEHAAHFIVRDTGIGMSAETLRHIFEPFFTTKKTGTGLGLSVAEQVVQRHGGTIDVESAPGAGTTFHVYLPLADEHDILAPEPMGAPDLRNAGHRILLVEDDEAVSLGLTSVLEMENMTVDVATSGRAAIAAIDASPPDLVLLDVGLPDMDGTAVYAEIAKRHPNLPVIFSTGHADRSKLEPLLDRPHVGYLLKPYETDALLDVIRKVLQS
ncbi:MAG TPA: PAS domain S-box protein [Thermoanaerobaculia bacterium]|nr:PAS domain S-box protein [Thermoanaerobaculia bacterium]